MRSITQLSHHSTRSARQGALAADAPAVPLDPAREKAVATALLLARAGEMLWIQRLPHDGCVAGWRVRIGKGPHRRRSRMFLDRDHGGAAAAFEQALRYRDACLAPVAAPCQETPPASSGPPD